MTTDFQTRLNEVSSLAWGAGCSLQALETFVATWIAGSEPSATELLLTHTPDGGGFTILDTVRPRAKRRERAAQLAERFLHGAAAHAVANPGSQRFSLAAMGGGTVLAQHMFRMGSPVGSGLGDPAGDPACSNAAIIKMTLRHSENLHRLLVQAHGSTLGLMTEQMQRMAKQLEHHDELQVTTMRLVEELHSRRHERELEVSGAQASEERSARMWQHAEQFAPMIMAQLAGATPMHKLLQSLAPEQFTALCESMNDEQRQMLRDLLVLAQASDQAATTLLRPETPGGAPKP